LLLRGEGKNAIEHIKNSIRYLEEKQGIGLLGFAWTVLGQGYYLLGELEIARKHVEKGLKIQNDAGIIFRLPWHYRVLAMVYFDSGDLKNAQLFIEESLKLSQENGEKEAEGLSRIWLGRILGKADNSQVGKGEEYILEGIKILEDLKLKPLSTGGYLFLGELYADIGQREKALENLKMAEGMFQEMGTDYWLAKTQETLGRL
jgi:tetratricopeptide (TPR) repeat protein